MQIVQNAYNHFEIVGQNTSFQTTQPYKDDFLIFVFTGVYRFFENRYNYFTKISKQSAKIKYFCNEHDTFVLRNFVAFKIIAVYVIFCLELDKKKLPTQISMEKNGKPPCAKNVLITFFTVSSIFLCNNFFQALAEDFHRINDNSLILVTRSSELQGHFSIKFQSFLWGKWDVNPFGSGYINEIKLTIAVNGYSGWNSILAISTYVYSETPSKLFSILFLIKGEWVQITGELRKMSFFKTQISFVRIE